MPFGAPAGPASFDMEAQALFSAPSLQSFLEAEGLSPARAKSLDVVGDSPLSHDRDEI